MKLEDCAAEIRPRRPWEAVDLGCALVRRWLHLLVPAWWITVFPVCFCVWVLLWNHPFLCIFCLWWLQPVFERLPLHIMSRSLFGDEIRPLAALKAWPKLLFRPFWTYWLTIRFRSLTTRSLHLPVRDLEGASGRFFGPRIRLIERHAGHTASLITFVAMLLLFGLMLGLIGVVFTFVPEIYLPRIGQLFELIAQAGPAAVPTAVWRTMAFLYIIASGIVQIVYVGAGFGLYINSRSHVEGWDIELTFRRLANRLKASQEASGQSSPRFIKLRKKTKTDPPAAGGRGQGTRMAIGLLAGCLLLAPFTVPEAEAQASKSRETVDRVLADPDFKVHSKTIRERLRQSRPRTSSPMGPLFSAVGYGLFWICVALLVAGLIWLILKYGKRIVPAGGAKMDRERPPSSVMGMSIVPESLPDDIITSARKLWAEGKAHEAVSLLYRGAISQLVLRESLPIRESDTESDCLRRSRALGNKSMVQYFAQLTRAWISTAYARRLPSESAMDTLCEKWPFSKGAL